MEAGRGAAEVGEMPPGGEKAGSPGGTSPATPRGGSKKRAFVFAKTKRLVAQRHGHPFRVGIGNTIDEVRTSGFGQGHFFDAHIRGDV